MTDGLPPDIREAFARTRTWEVTTRTRKEEPPLTAPMLPPWRPGHGAVIAESGLRPRRAPGRHPGAPTLANPEHRAVPAGPAPVGHLRRMRAGAVQ